MRAAGVLLVALWLAPAAAGADGLDRGAALAASQAVIDGRLESFTLLARDGHPVELAELADRPLLVSVVYTACVHACSVTTHYLKRAVAQAESALGADAFRVVTIGFDVPVDSPESMREFAARHSIDHPGWHFLSMRDPAAMARLLDQLGFSYAPSARGYDHVVQLSLVDASLTLRRQVYGETFDLPLLIEPLKDMVWGRPLAGQGFWSRLVDRVRLLCTVYDEHGGRYVFDYSMFISLLIGALVVGSVLAWLLREAGRLRGAR